MKNKLSNNSTESKYQEGNGTILNIMVLNVCYYCTEQLAFKAITSVSCTSSISEKDECESRECLIHGLRESSHCIYLSGSKSYQIAVRDMKLFFPEGLCCAECQTLEEEEVGFCPFLRSVLLCQSSGFSPASPWLLSYYALANAFFAVSPAAEFSFSCGCSYHNVLTLYWPRQSQWKSAFSDTFAQ